MFMDWSTLRSRVVEGELLANNTLNVIETIAATGVNQMWSKHCRGGHGGGPAVIAVSR
jgi:hypothetical protein